MNTPFDTENIAEDPISEAIKNGTLPQFYLNTFINYYENYKNDLPPIDVRLLATLDENGQFKGDNYKCRGNTITGICLYLSGAVEEHVIIDPDLIQKIEKVRHWDFKFHHGKFTSKEEITMINDILHEVIHYLKHKV